MATLYRDFVTISKDAGFLGRVNYAVTLAAVNVASEDPNTPNHPARKAFADNVFKGNYSVTAVALLALTNSTVANEANVATTPDFAIVDSDLQNAINGLWNDLSGV